MANLTRRQLLISGIGFSTPSLLSDPLLDWAGNFSEQKALSVHNVTAPPFHSPEVEADNRITFRIWAPRASKVELRDGDLYLRQGQKYPPAFMRDPEGLWTASSEPVPSGSYRYLMDVDGIPTVDPINTSVSESNSMVWSLVVVRESDAEREAGRTSRGSVSSVCYYSSTLRRDRRMHVYTPAGYGLHLTKYPVLYLLHGSGDSDNTWSSVGRANFILDAMISSKQSTPMVVVMPAGHLSRGEDSMPSPKEKEKFTEDFGKDIMPYINRNYRVFPDRAHTALSGVSMGGEQAINLLMSYPASFAYAGIWSAGIFERSQSSSLDRERVVAIDPIWIQRNASMLENKNLKRGLKLFSFQIGADDGLISIARATVSMFRAHGFNAVLTESSGGHSWYNWRAYLANFLPQIFASKGS